MTTFYTKDMELSPGQVLVLQITLQITLAAADVPLSLLADRYGLRRMAIIGSAVQFVALAGFVFCATFGQFVLALAGSGLYSAAQQNVTSSIMASSLNGDRQLYAKYETRVTLLRYLGIVTGVCIGAALVYVEMPMLLFQLQPVTCVISLVIALRIIEPARKQPMLTLEVVVSVTRHMLIERPGIRAAILLNTSILSCGFVCFWMFQLQLEATGLNDRYFGVVYIVHQLVGPLFATCISWLRGPKCKRDLGLWAAASVIMAGLAIATGLVASIIIVFVLMAAQVCTVALLGVLIWTFIYETLPDDYSTRTAELSVSTTVTSIGYIVASLFASVVVERISVDAVFVVVGVLSLGLNGLAFWVFQKHVQGSR